MSRAGGRYIVAFFSKHVAGSIVSDTSLLFRFSFLRFRHQALCRVWGLKHKALREFHHYLWQRSWPFAPDLITVLCTTRFATGAFAQRALLRCPRQLDFPWNCKNSMSGNILCCILFTLDQLINVMVFPVTGRCHGTERSAAQVLARGPRLLVCGRRLLGRRP